MESGPDAYMQCAAPIFDALLADGRAEFTVPTGAGYYVGCSERCIEIPWALSGYSGQKRILDVGVSLADQVYFESLLRLFDLGAEEIHGVDIIPMERTLRRFKSLPQERVRRVVFRNADARHTGYPNDHFDLIFLVSTVEHIGFDEELARPGEDTVFNRPLEPPDRQPDLTTHRADFDAMRELGRILKPGGSLLVTVPFGRVEPVLIQDSKHRYCFFVQYDTARWKSLLAASGLIMSEERFFGHDPRRGWEEVRDPESLEDKDFLPDQMMASAVACGRLTKGKG